VDSAAKPPDVIGADLRRGIPFPDASFDAVYHSHLLEHFSRVDAEAFIRECHRVLRRGGVMRVAVPDLETIARLYLARLEAVLGGDQAAEPDYDWMLLEMYDQTVRTESGGQMQRVLRQENLPNAEFIVERMGWRRPGSVEVPVRGKAAVRKRRPWRRWWEVQRVAERFKKLVLGQEYALLKEARFRRSGEIHAWMYDEFSLGRLMKSQGFADVVRCVAGESRIPSWSVYLLDAEADGAVRKPDSLFMECRKP
jgi:SAM-dependent methyltransferase